ncbi:hypothetical protein [Pseudoalteromonas denitrificans]|uniref:Uncharacterized protein n=1 Tax=Pseudoalteromonas denitrificans DSM 6059 TaxID=1123010 RepID=A0A1I1ETM1_9GAMM|nr:hypothetical protein [Pseudoalteromonas denitrificans]SFB90421.1 hypothetical protein SAMN02745724_00436 [Pseudoalteromonas denitrificans DSM 6059]
MSLCISIDNNGNVINKPETISQCQDFILMSPNDFNANAAGQFDPLAYDTGFSGVIEMFVAGIGIGVILALLNKLRR